MWKFHRKFHLFLSGFLDTAEKVYYCLRRRELLQLFPEIEGIMLQPLKDAYIYYESKKLEDDLANDDHNRNKVYRKV